MKGVASFALNHFRRFSSSRGVYAMDPWKGDTSKNLMRAEATIFCKGSDRATLSLRNEASCRRLSTHTNDMQSRLRAQLLKRAEAGSLRKPQQPASIASNHRPDFSSNDYLGLARSIDLYHKVDLAYKELYHDNNSSSLSNEIGGEIESIPMLGATGSRLLSGDTAFARQLEAWLANEVHNQQAALLFNSGYDANIGILSSILMDGDIALMDELSHNSLFMGVRMSRSTSCHTFRHNDVDDLRLKLQDSRRMKSSGLTDSQIVVVVESVYSMDGDVAPLQEILDMASEFGASVVVDEAHGMGVFGRTNTKQLSLPETETSDRAHQTTGNNQTIDNETWGGTGVLAALELEEHPALLCAVFTFGKAGGCHGAVVCGSTLLRDYLWNYARPFVYSTALPMHSLVTIRCAYQEIIGQAGERKRKQLFSNVRVFRSRMSLALEDSSVQLWPSPSPVQALLIRGNKTCVEFCERVARRSRIRLYPIRAPTVPIGQERVRIVLHSHNTNGQLNHLVDTLVEVLTEMQLLSASSSSTKFRSKSRL